MLSQLLLEEIERTGVDHATLASVLGISVCELSDLISYEDEYTTLSLASLGRLMTFLKAQTLADLFEDPNQFMAANPDFAVGRPTISNRDAFSFEELVHDLEDFIGRIGKTRAEEQLGWSNLELFLSSPIPAEQIGLIQLLDISYSLGRDWRFLRMEDVYGFGRMVP